MTVVEFASFPGRAYMRNQFALQLSEASFVSRTSYQYLTRPASSAHGAVFVPASSQMAAFARTAGKIALVGIVIYLIVPASVRLSDMVYQTQAAKVNDAIDQYNDLEIGGDTDGGIISEFTSITTETIDHITDFVEDLMESLAVMVVTSCVIPVLVFVFLIWLVKVIFSANILTLDSSVVEAIAKRIKG